MKEDIYEKKHLCFDCMCLSCSVLRWLWRWEASWGHVTDDTSVAVETQEIALQPMEQYVSVSSKVSSEQEVSVVPKTSGTVKKLYIGLGDTVKAGDILFEIDDTEARLQVQQAQASLESAQANYDQNVGGSLETQLDQMQATVDSYQIQYDDLKKELEETEALYEIGAASQSEADNLKSSVNKAKIQLESAQKQLELNKGSILEDTKKSLQVNITQAEASLASAQKQLDDTKVRVEIDGIIGTLNISEGSVVNAQGEAMTLVNMDNLKVSFHVSEDVINEISVGSPVYITVSAVSDDPMTATVTNISEAADSSTRLYQVEAALSNTEGNLKPGMFANVRLVTETKEDTIVVPLNTVLTDNGEKYVFVVDENNIAHKTVVETGLENDTYIEITSGLNIGDTVVTKGQDFLSDGNTVNITNGTTEQESIAEVPEQE